MTGVQTCALPILKCGDSVMIAIRPEHIELAPRGDAGENALQATVDTVSFIGNQTECGVRVGEQTLKVLLHPERAPATGGTCTLYVTPDHCLALGA